VALKLLHRDFASDPDLAERFLREGRAAARLCSDHVARVLDAGTTDDGASFLVMERLEGKDLAALTEERGALPIDEAVDYLLQACEGVAAAHALGIVHRDLKPGNLFLTRGPDGAPLVKVLDFGLSKVESSDARGGLTSEHRVFGSPHFMSPEQMRSSREVDARGDVWALGVVLYAFVCGRVPFSGSHLTEIVAAVLTGAAPPPSTLRPGLPEGLEEVILRCLRVDRDERFASVADLAAALGPYAPVAGGSRVARIERLRAQGNAAAPPVSGTRPVSAVVRVDTTLSYAGDVAPTMLQTRPSARRHKWIAIGALAGAVLAGIGLVFARPSTPAALAVAAEGRGVDPAVAVAPIADMPPVLLPSMESAPSDVATSGIDTRPPATVASARVAPAAPKRAPPRAAPAPRPKRSSDDSLIMQLPH
jgi:serine/threonine-protein kinase